MPLAIASLPRQLVYVTALELGVARLKTLSLSVRLVRESHEELMTRMRGDHATPGESRRSQSWIGPPGCTLSQATYVPPPHKEMLDHSGAWKVPPRRNSAAFGTDRADLRSILRCRAMSYGFRSTAALLLPSM